MATVDRTRDGSIYDIKVARPGTLTDRASKWRMTRWGIPYRLRRTFFEGVRRNFANRWVMTEDRADKFLQVYGGEYSPIKSMTAICSGFGVRKVQWKATMAYLLREFHDAPEVDLFLAKLADRVGDWLTLRVWADRLDDLESPFGSKLRELLPL